MHAGGEPGLSKVCKLRLPRLGFVFGQDLCDFRSHAIKLMMDFGMHLLTQRFKMQRGFEHHFLERLFCASSRARRREIG